ncbi:hypothetical protein DESC_460124 [Desulfosarcina cetonica]|nr:hypothetical protein DESC_460124 [Desulfosarcina cetonica]
MKTVPHGNGLEAAGGCPGQLERHAHRAGAPRDQQHLAQGHGGDFRQFLGQRDCRNVGVAPRAEGQAIQLRLDGGDHPGVAVAHLVDAVAVKIEDLAALAIGQGGSLTAIEQIEARRGETLAQVGARIAVEPGLGLPVDVAELPGLAITRAVAVALAGHIRAVVGWVRHAAVLLFVAPAASGCSPSTKRRLIASTTARHSQIPRTT